MFHSLNEFLDIWQHEAESTVKLFQSLTDASLDQRINEEGRTMARLANHIIETLSEMPHKLGLPVKEEQPVQTTAAGIVSGYQQANAELVEALKSAWTDADLERDTNMYGQTWRNGFTLFVLLNHQTHHRGQMTVLMRQSGLAVPGMVGPSREEWAAMNIPALP